MSVYKNVNGRRTVRSWCAERIGAWDVDHVRHEVVTSAGLTSVLTAGPVAGDGVRSVVLLPGTNMNAALCLPVAGMLAAERRTVVLDVPGQPGLSSDRRPARGRMTWYGSWLGEALEQTVPGPVVVVGHSLGGAIALACDSPQIIGRVLLSTAGLTRLRVPAALMAATVPWLVRPSVPRASRLLRHMSAPGRLLPTELCEWMAMVARCCRSSLAPAPLPPALVDRRRPVPCVVATGHHDVFLPPHVLSPAVRRRLGTNLKVVDDAGHLILDEEPARVAAMVHEFCTTL